MPTENRSSNTEMVSDSEMTECQFHNNCGGWCETRRELEHNLCEHCLESHDEEMAEPATAQQPSPEPATPYGWHVEWADSGDHYLFTKVEKRIEALRLDSDVKVVQLFTHADPGEVERLREHVSAYEASRERLHGWLQQEQIKIITLRAQLAEQDALLRGALSELQAMKDEIGFRGNTLQVMTGIEAALSASAEPIQPAAPYPNRLCHIDYTAHPYRCGCLRGDEESQRIYDEHCRATRAEPNDSVTAEAKP